MGEKARKDNFTLLQGLRTGALVLACLLTTEAAAEDTADSRALRVCADGNNLPYSNDAQEGFENVLAGLLAEELGRDLEYTWWPQRRGFIRHTLDAGRCDMVMGVPADYERTATTSPYYRSGYVAVTRAADKLDIEHLEDPRLRELRIGIHVVGDDYSNPPPAQILAAQGIRDNVKGYSIYGDYSQPDPTRSLIDAVASGEIDVAFAWGPIAGYFARQQEPPLDITPVQSASSSLPLAFDMAIGVRHEDKELRQALDRALRSRRQAVRDLLGRYHIPVLDPSSSHDGGQAARRKGSGHGKASQ